VLTKSVDVPVAPCGYGVGYTITVENQTPGFLLLHYAYDSLMGDVFEEFPSVLAPGESGDAQYWYPLGCDDPDPLVNTIEVLYRNESDDPYWGSAEAVVDILHPQLDYTIECPDPPPPPGEDLMILVGLTNVGDVTVVLDIEDPYPGLVELSVGETLTLEMFVPCVGDQACGDVFVIVDLPFEYGISFPFELILEPCCPCNGSPVEETSWGKVKGAWR
jgi:hypothetical protein